MTSGVFIVEYREDSRAWHVCRQSEYPEKAEAVVPYSGTHPYLPVRLNNKYTYIICQPADVSKESVVFRGLADCEPLQQNNCADLFAEAREAWAIAGEPESAPTEAEPWVLPALHFRNFWISGHKQRPRVGTGTDMKARDVYMEEQRAAKLKEAQRTAKERRAAQKVEKSAAVEVQPAEPTIAVDRHEFVVMIAQDWMPADAYVLSSTIPHEHVCFHMIYLSEALTTDQEAVAAVLDHSADILEGLPAKDHNTILAYIIERVFYKYNTPGMS